MNVGEQTPPQPQAVEFQQAAGDAPRETLFTDVRSWAALALAAVATAAFLVAFLNRWFPLGVPDQYQYFRLGRWDLPITPWLALAPAAVAALALIGLTVWCMAWIETAGRRRFLLTLGGVILLGGAFQIMLEIAAPGGLEKWSILYHGFRAAARTEFADVPSVMARHAEVAASFEPNHIATNPAGWIVVYRALLSFYDRHPRAADAVWSIEPNEIAWSLRRQLHTRGAPLADQATVTTVAYGSRAAAFLVALPVAWLVRQRHSRRAAVAAASMSLLVPAATLLAPAVDSVYPTFATLIVALSYYAGRPGAWPAAALAGALIGVGMLFSLSYLVVAAICAIMVAWRAAQGRRATIAAMIAAPSAWLCVLLTTWLVLGYRMWESWRVNLTKNHEFNLYSGCTYAAWLPVNLAEFCVAIGIPVVTFLLARASGAMTRKGRRPADPVAAAWGATLVLLAVLCLNRGEIARLWLFLMPLGAAFSVESLDLRSKAQRAVLAGVLLLQTMEGLALVREVMVLCVWLPHDATQLLLESPDQWRDVRRLTDEELVRRGGQPAQYPAAVGIQPAQIVYLWSAHAPKVGATSDEKSYSRLVKADRAHDVATLNSLTESGSLALLPQNTKAAVVRTGKHTHLVQILGSGKNPSVYVGVDDVHAEKKRE